jgi:hypothetical protein
MRFKTYDFRKTHKSRVNLDNINTALSKEILVNFIIYTINLKSQRGLTKVDEYNIRRMVLFLLEYLNTNVFLLSLIYYERIEVKEIEEVESDDDYWSWIGVLILADCYLNDKSYSNKSWMEYFKIPKRSIVKLKKKSLINLDYSLFCTMVEFKTMQDKLINLLDSSDKVV